MRWVSVFFALFIFSGNARASTCVDALRIELSTFTMSGIKNARSWKSFLTFLNQSGARFEWDGNQLTLARTILPSGKFLPEELFTALQSKNPDFKTLNEILKPLLPDPGKLLNQDWTGLGAHRFQGTIEEMVEKEVFREMQFVRGPKAGEMLIASHDQVIAMQVNHQLSDAEFSANWNFVGQISGKESRSPLQFLHKQDDVFREFFWTTVDIGFDRTFPRIDPYNVRVAVTSVGGIERDAEVFVFDQTTQAWNALAFERIEHKWVRVHTRNRASVPEGCMGCHGYGKDFGPTPKLVEYERPEKWFTVKKYIESSKSIEERLPNFGSIEDGVSGDSPSSKKIQKVMKL